MTYIQWRDELDGYLRILPKDEREKVFDYFSEMYADKRDAGFKEREIIAEFGAPYDAAQRILHEADCDSEDNPYPAEARVRGAENSADNHKAEPERKGGHGFLRALTSILLCLPVTCLAIIIFAIAIVFACVPVSVIIGGFAVIGAAIGGMASAGNVVGALHILGTGIIIVGAGFMLAAPCFGLVKVLFKLIKKNFVFLKRIACGRKTR